MKVVVHKDDALFEYENASVTFAFDGPEAKGEINIIPYVFIGLDIYIPSVGDGAVAFIDLSPGSEEEEEDCPRLYIYGQIQDGPMAHVNFKPVNTQIVVGEAL